MGQCHIHWRRSGLPGEGQKNGSGVSFHAVFLGHSGHPNHPGVTEVEGGGARG